MTPLMRRWRQVGIATAVMASAGLAVSVVLPFLAPDLSYQVKDRAAETLSGRRNRPFRIALGAASGSYYRLGTILNRYLEEKSGYQLELVATAGVPENVGALLDVTQGIDLATIESSSDEGARAERLYGLAAVGQQYFFVIVPDASPVREFRDLTGPVNTGVRGEGHAPTLGERVLEYYGLIGPGLHTPSEATSAEAPVVSVVRPSSRGIVDDFRAGHMTAATRTQFLHADLIDDVLRDGAYRLVPIRDHEALSRALPGTTAAFIPAGAYGPRRGIPYEPTPTLAVSTLLVARQDLPGRVARDILEVVYDPRFARDLQQPITEETGRQVGALRLHPAAEIFYRRNDLVTSDRIGRVSFVASLVAALFTAVQFLGRLRRNERRTVRRRLLSAELGKLEAIRHRIERADRTEADALIAEADDLLSQAEHDASAGLLDREGIESLRSLHGICWRALRQRRGDPGVDAAAGRSVELPSAP
jgi:TRAP-type uncharacterized transport system substrate-binding protein